MDSNKNSYTILYAVVMVVVVALLLAIVSGALKSKQTANVALDKKKQILSALKLNTKGENAEVLYDRYIPHAFVVNSKGEIVSEDRDRAFKIDVRKEMDKPLDQRELPVYVAQVDGQAKYILSVHGAGLWGAIWGYVSFNSDKNTVYGAYFSHASETPGLGAEIAYPKFQDRFIEKKIMDKQGKFVSIAVVKPGKKDAARDYVDGISGGTITSKGVEDMLYNSIGQYESFMNKSTTEEK